MYSAVLLDRGQITRNQRIELSGVQIAQLCVYISTPKNVSIYVINLLNRTSDKIIDDTNVRNGRLHNERYFPLSYIRSLTRKK